MKTKKKMNAHLAINSWKYKKNEATHNWGESTRNEMKCWGKKDIRNLEEI